MELLFKSPETTSITWLEDPHPPLGGGKKICFTFMVPQANKKKPGNFELVLPVHGTGSESRSHLVTDSQGLLRIGNDPDICYKIHLKMVWLQTNRLWEMSSYVSKSPPSRQVYVIFFSAPWWVISLLCCFFTTMLNIDQVFFLTSILSVTTSIHLSFFDQVLKKSAGIAENLQY